MTKFVDYFRPWKKTNEQLAATQAQLVETQRQLRDVRKVSTELMIRGYQSGWYTMLTKGQERPVDMLGYAELYKTYRKSSCVRACVDTIAREVSVHKWQIVAKEGKSPTPAEIKFVEDKLKNPNVNKESFQQLRFKLTVDMLVYDVAVIEKVRNLNKQVLELWVRDGSTFKPVVDRHGVISSYYQSVLVAGKDIEFDGNDIVFFILHPQSNSVYGLPIIESICDEVSSLLFANAFVANTFTDDEIPPGILALGEIGQEAYERAKANFKEERGRYHHRIKIISGLAKEDKFEWVRLDRPARDMQLVELVEKIDRAIYRAFGVSPVSMGQEGANRATAEVQYRVTDDRILGPVLGTQEYYFNNEIIPEWSDQVEFRYQEMTVDASRDHAQSSSFYIRNGVLSVNEVRKDMGRDPVDGGDEHFLLPGLEPVPVSELAKKAPEGAQKRHACCHPPTAAEWVEIKKRHKQIVDVDALLKIKAQYELDMLKFWRIARKKVVRIVSKDIILKRVSQDDEYLPEKRREIEEQLSVLTDRLNKSAEKYYPLALAVGVASAKKITGKSVLTDEQAKTLLDERYQWNDTYLRENLIKDVRRNSQFAMLETFETEDEFREAAERIFDAEEARVGRYASAVWGVGQKGFAAEMFEQDKGRCYWITTSGRECPDCAMLASGSPYSSLSDLGAVPGDGSTICDGECYCLIEFK